MKKVVKKKKRVRKSPFSTKSSKGISKVLIIAVVAVVLAGLGGMYVMSQNGLNVGMPSVVKAPLNPNCELKDPELCKFMNNWVTQKNYAMTTTSKMGGMTMESVYETSGEGTYHMMSKQDGKENSNMIMIGDDTYTLDYTDNKWWKTTYKEEDKAQVKEIQEQFSLDEGEETEDNTTYKFITKEACGNLMCFKYEMVMPDSQGMKSYLWFDDSEYLLRKTVYESAEDGSSESLYTYGGVNISAPSPVKEGTPGMGAGSGMTAEEAQRLMDQYQQQADVASYDTEMPVESEPDY